MAVVEGSNPGLLRHVATGLRATATVAAGVSTTYLTLATIETMKRSGTGPSAWVDDLARQARIDKYMRQAREYTELSNAMMGAANSADSKAATQDAVSDASGFIQPTTDLPDLPDLPDPPLDDDFPADPVEDPVGSGPSGGGQSGGGPSGGGQSGGLSGLVGNPGLSGGGGADTGGGTYLGSAGSGPYLDGAGAGGDPGAAAGADGAQATGTEAAGGPQQPDQGVLGLVPGGAVGVGVAAAALAGAGIAASVVRANRKKKHRDEDEDEDEERDGDRVEAVYQAGPPERPASR
jgi:hypothetical protein